MLIDLLFEMLFKNFHLMMKSIKFLLVIAVGYVFTYA